MPTDRLNFIVNADDFGIGESVNTAVADSIERGLVTSASIMANGPAVAGAINYAVKNPRVPYGIHLNVTEFSQLSGANLGALRDDGVLNNKIRGVNLDPSLLNQIYIEMEAQILSLKSAGINLSHIDSHNHTHTIPQVFPVVLFLARRHGIRRIRISRNLFRGDERLGRSFILAKQAFNGFVRVCGVSRSDYFGSLLDFMQSERPLRRESRIEIMVHPGAVGAEQEMQLLSSPWWTRACEQPVFENAVTLG